jgi:hypothetical protein
MVIKNKRKIVRKEDVIRMKIIVLIQIDMVLNNKSINLFLLVYTLTIRKT